MAITISPARPADAAAMAELLEEMDRFYGADAAAPLAERVGQLSEAVFASPPAAYVLLAWDGDQLAGLAAYSFLWPAVGLTSSLYLKELYVADRYRGRGIGRLLMQGLFEAAAKRGCSRVEWTTDRENAGAQAFYERLGVPAHPSKIFYRVEDNGAGLRFPGESAGQRLEPRVPWCDGARSSCPLISLHFRERQADPAGTVLISRQYPCWSGAKVSRTRIVPWVSVTWTPDAVMEMVPLVAVVDAATESGRSMSIPVFSVEPGLGAIFPDTTRTVWPAVVPAWKESLAAFGTIHFSLWLTQMASVSEEFPQANLPEMV